MAMPDLWDAKGQWQGATDPEREKMSALESELYDRCHRAHDAARQSETRVADLTKQLHATVADSRAILAKLSKLPKPTFMDNWRAMRAAGG